MTPDVSVIMAACNQGDWVRKTVPLAHESLGAVSHEIIVVDDQSTDRCCHGLGTDALVVHTRSRLGVSQSRRLGYEQSRGRVIIWSDPHCEYPDGALQRLYVLARDSDAIFQPRTKHRPERRKSAAGSVLAISDRGLWTKPQNIAAPHPALYNTIYAVNRETYEKLGGWPALPGVWGYSEQAMSLMAWFAGVPIRVDEESLGIHYLYQKDREFPFSAPRSDWAANCHWVHKAFLPETYETFWRPKILRYFGDDYENEAPVHKRPWRAFARHVKKTRVKTENQFFEQVLGIPLPNGTADAFIESQRPRAEPKEHRAAHRRVNHALKWMQRAVPGCMKGRKILDVGTRDGYALQRFDAMGARDVRGVEVVPETATFAQESTNHIVEAADMRSLPYTEGEFCLTSCIHTLEHVPDPDKALAELVRVTKPTGWVFVVVPLEAKARQQYAHFCEFPEVQSLIDLVATDDRLDIRTLQTSTAPYSGEQMEARLLVRRKSARHARRIVRENPKVKPQSEAVTDSKNNRDCKGAQYWTSWDAGSTECEVAEMVAGLVRGLQPETVVETGTSIGRTAELIGKALKQNGHGTLYTLENDIDLMRQARSRCRDLPVICVDIDSLKWEPPRECEIEFAYFDSRHKIRVPEFHHLRPWMSKRTIVAFHDTSPRKGTRAPVEQLASEGWISPVFLPTPRGICIARVMK